MHFIFDQVVQFKHIHHTHGDRLVIRNTGLAIPQNLLAQGGRWDAPFQHGGFGDGLNIFIRNVIVAQGMQPEFGADLNGTLVERGTFRRRRDLVSEDGDRVDFMITQPFGHGGVAGVIDFIQPVHIVAAVAQPLLQVEPADFAIIFDRLRTVILGL